MRKFFSLFAMLLLVAACESTPGEDGMGGAGGGAGGTMGKAAAGTTRDFVENVGDRVFFDFDQSSLSSDARATLDKQAEWLKRYAAVRVTVEGHCDERGTREYNLALGERRALAAKNYLIAAGVDAGRVTTVSFGKERPAVLGANEAAWGQNRRAVTVVAN